jgi:hypothetical protein
MHHAPKAADSSPPTEASRVAVGLPTNEQAILTSQPKGSLNAADRIYEVAPQPPLASVASNPDSTALLQGIKELSCQVAALSNEQDHFHASFRDPHLRPIPATRHASPATFVHSYLEKCTHMFLWQDTTRRALEPPYSGPYQVLSQREKIIKILVHGRPITVSTDRVKPVYMLSEC